MGAEPHATPEQLGRRLFQGHGRAHALLRAADSAPYREVLLQACIASSVFDLQVSELRSDYLLDLIDLTGDAAWFRERIIDALADPAEDADLDQLCDFALHYAQAGDARARLALYERFAESLRSDDLLGGSEIVALDGLEGFRSAAAQVGAQLALSPELEPDAQLVRELEDQLGPEALAAALAELSAADPHIQRYLEHPNVRPRPPRSATVQPEALPYAELRALLAGAQPTGGYRLARWGRAASPADLLAAAHDLPEDPQAPLLLQYLRIFQDVALPLGPERLLALVEHPHIRTVNAALGALSNFNDPQVRALAWRLIAEEPDATPPADAHEPHHRVSGLRLLPRNFAPDDGPRLQALLARARDDERLHNVGFWVLDILAANRCEQAAALLAEIYERGPCSLCRTSAVEQLIALGAAPRWLLEECLHDVEEPTRACARAALGAEVA